MPDVETVDEITLKCRVIFRLWQPGLMNLYRGLAVKVALTLIGVIVLCFCIHYSFVASLHKQKQSFEADALTVSAAYRSAMDVVDGIATSLSALHIAHPETRNTFAETLLENYPFIQGFGRFRKVPGELAAGYLEMQSIVDGGSSSTVWRFDNQRRRIAVLPESAQSSAGSGVNHLYPVTVSLPPASSNDAGANQSMSITGFDLGSVMSINTAIRRASELGKTEIVNAPALWPDNSNVIAFRSLYRDGVIPEQIDERRDAMTGGYWLEIDFDALGSPMELVASLGLGLSFSLADNGSEFQLSDSTELHHRSMPKSDLLFARWLKPNTWITSFQVADRTYTISLSQHRGMSRTAFFYWLFGVGGVLGSVLIITILNADRLKAERQQRIQSARLFYEQQRAAAILLHIKDAVISTDTEGCIQYVNKSAEDLLHVNAEQITGEPIHSIFETTPEGDRRQSLKGDDSYTAEGVFSRERSLYLEGGNSIVVNETVSPVCDADGCCTGSVVVLRDVTAEKELTRRLQHQIHHDPLTGLANRSKYEDRMRILLDEESIGKISHALCLIDLDRFKLVNDTCGHAAGDQLLVELCDALAARIRAEDLLARLGGDEFAVVIENCDLESARGIANRLHRFFNNYYFEFDNKVFPVRGSIGMVHFDPAEVDLKAVSSAADAACYKAKSSGRNTIHVYTDADRALDQTGDEQQWLPWLEQSIGSEGFVLHVQPICEIKGGKMVSPQFHEILLRMKDRNDGNRLVHPSQFLKSAERHGLMREIDEWVIRTSLDTIGALSEDFALDVFSINLSSTFFDREDFFEFLSRQLEVHSVCASQLCFEVTEESVLNNYEAAKLAIYNMKKLGCAVALDHFGSGVSSLSSLQELSLDYIKIDGRFIADIETSPMNECMLKSIHSFACAMGLKTIAEQVETQRAWEHVSNCGVHFVQGYYVGYPTPFNEQFNYAQAA